jgi:hypothetical protein
VEAVASVLYGWDLSSFHAREFPHTAFRQAQQIQGVAANSVEKWLMERLERQSPLSVEVGQPPWEEWRRKDWVYADYKQQAGLHPKPSHVFWKEMQAMGVVASTKQDRSGGTSVQLVRFQPLSACKAAFSQAMGAQQWKFDDEAMEE